MDAAIEGGMDLKQAVDRTLLVIPSVDGAHLLERMLPTLRLPGSSVLVIDQGSTDATVELCEAHGVGLLRVGGRLTYTQACNLGARLAKARGCEFLFVGNNDIAFQTDVVRECLAELIADPRLGIVAPSQIIVDAAAGPDVHAYRVFWHLQHRVFQHDTRPPPPGTRRLEADFCELTLAGLRLSTLDEVGFLDDEFGFYHEDADFGFRLREAGYGCAYLPRSTIRHWTSSTLKPGSARQAYYSAKNTRLFLEKHVSEQVLHRDHGSREVHSWARINRHLHRTLSEMGMINPACPELIFSHPGTRPLDHLFTVWETTRLPDRWLQYAGLYRTVMTTSRWGTQVLRDEGFAGAAYVPLGVESDVFTPWGEAARRYECKTFLWLAHNQHRKGLDVMLAAWAAFRRLRPLAHLVVMGAGVRAGFTHAPDFAYRSPYVEIGEFVDEGVSVHEVRAPLSDEELAALYRGVDFTVCTSRSEGFGFVVAESLACGRPAIFGDYGGTRDFLYPGALSFGGRPVPADYSDKGFGAVGDWWEPDLDGLVARLVEAYDMDAPAYAALSAAGVRAMRAGFSWRNTGFALRAALERGAQAERAAALPAPARPTGPQAHPSPLVAPGLPVPACRFVGYVEGDLGLGQALRNDIGAARAAAIPASVYPYNVGIETRRIGAFLPELYDPAGVSPVDIVCVATEHVPAVLQALPARPAGSGYTILRAYWELPRAPRAWRACLAGVDEIWAPSAFVADAFREVFERPIRIVPTAVEVESGPRPGRARFGMEEGRFYFLYSFDYFSSPHRKNPLGLIWAFRQAFPSGDEKVGLVLKSIGPAAAHPAVQEEIEAAMAADPRLIRLDGTLAREEMLGLIGAADAYVSLHRSEGFGVGMAEAMMMGKIVIGTDFAGSRDFLSARTGFPVPYALRAVRPDEYAWARGQVWADPSTQEAARIMRAVAARPEEARLRAQEGARFIAAGFSREAVGRAMRRRLAELAPALAARGVPFRSDAVAAARP